MVYYKNGKYHLSNLKVHYKEKYEGEVIKYIGQEGKEWWEEFAELWKDTFELIGFIETEHTEEQKDRLDKVNELNLYEGISLIDEYVLYGKFEKELEDGTTVEVDRGHPLYMLKVEEQSKILEKSLMEISLMIGGML